MVRSHYRPPSPRSRISRKIREARQERASSCIRRFSASPGVPGHPGKGAGIFAGRGWVRLDHDVPQRLQYTFRLTAASTACNAACARNSSGWRGGASGRGLALRLRFGVQPHPAQGVRPVKPERISGHRLLPSLQGGRPTTRPRGHRGSRETPANRAICQVESGVCAAGESTRGDSIGEVVPPEARSRASPGMPDSAVPRDPRGLAR